jgi:hypothetical protein
MIRAIACLFIVVAPLAGGCSLTAPAPSATATSAHGCPVAGQQRMTMLKMYFGRARVSDAAWDAFRDSTIAAAFPDGFTVYDATGAWRPEPNAPTSHERASVLEVALPRGADVAAKATSVAEAYKQRFAQLSVGVVTWRVCGVF